MQWVSGGCGWCQRNKKIVYVAHSNHMDWIALLSMPLFLANGLTCVWGICWSMFINWAYSNMYGNNCAVSGTIITSSNGEVIICLWFKIQCIWKCIKTCKRTCMSLIQWKSCTAVYWRLPYCLLEQLLLLLQKSHQCLASDWVSKKLCQMNLHLCIQDLQELYQER